MRVVREPYPPRGYLVGIAISRRRTLIAVGDVMAVIPNSSPWLRSMAMTPMEDICRQKFVDVNATIRWANDYEKGDYKTEARALRALIEWAKEEARKIRGEHFAKFAE